MITSYDKRLSLSPVRGESVIDASKVWFPIRLSIENRYYLNEVTIYLIKTPRGFALIDAGLNTEMAFSSLKKGLNSLGLDVSDIRSIYLTHYHLDHSGLCRRILKSASVYIFMSMNERYTLDFMNNHVDLYPEMLEEFFKTYGVPVYIIEHIKKQILFYKNLLRCPDEDNVLSIEELEEIELEHGYLKVIPTPGHTPGHTSFYYPEERVLFGGDFVMRDEWPHVGVYPHNPPEYNPLKDYLVSIQKIENLNIEMILPSHGDFILKPKERLFEIKNFISYKIRSILELFKEKKIVSIMEISEHIFKIYKFRLSLKYFFVLTLSLAYLRYLEGEGFIKSEKTDSGIRYVVVQKLSPLKRSPKLHNSIS